MKKIDGTDLHAFFGVNHLYEFTLNGEDRVFRIDEGILYYRSDLNEWVEEKELRINQLLNSEVKIRRHIAWIPKVNETYWSITSTLDVCGCVNTNDRFDESRIAFGNAYKTKEDCLHAKRYIIQSFLEAKSRIYGTEL